MALPTRGSGLSPADRGSELVLALALEGRGGSSAAAHRRGGEGDEDFGATIACGRIVANGAAGIRDAPHMEERLSSEQR